MPALLKSVRISQIRDALLLGYRHSRSRSEKCLLTHDLLWPCAFVLCGAHGRVWLCVIFCSRARRPAAFFHRWERGLSPLPSSSNLGGRGRAPPLRTQNKPPSSEGGVMTAGHDGGRDDRPLHFRSLPQSRLRSTAPSSEGAKDISVPIKNSGHAAF